VSAKVVAAINSMNKQGHYARVYRRQDKMWVEIDQCMLASFHEIEELVDMRKRWPAFSFYCSQNYFQFGYLCAMMHSATSLIFALYRMATYD
jgi:hypothetical protein